MSHRPNPAITPITLISCTTEDDKVKWMKKIEEEGPYMSEIDDYKGELNEVIHDQGPAFPYTKGLWILCLLVGAINPYDLDALDDSRPLSKYTVDNIMGRVITMDEYKKYWNSHPKHLEHEANYSRFSTEQKHTEQILGKTSIGAINKIANRFKSFGF